MKRCIHCDYTLNDGDMICPSCGQSQNNGTPQIDYSWEEQRKKRVRNSVIAVIAVLVFIGLRITAYIITSKDKHEGKQSASSYSTPVSTAKKESSSSETSKTEAKNEAVATSKPQQPEPIIKEFLTSTEDNDDGSYSVHYTICIHNPSTTDMLYPIYKITAYNADGKILDKNSYGFRSIAPDSDYWKSYYGLKTYEYPSEIKVEITSSTYTDLNESKYKNIEPLQVINHEIKENSVGTQFIVFDLQNNNDLSFPDVEMNIIYHDNDGNVLCGSTGDSNYLHDIEPNSVETFEERFYPKSDNYEIYIYPCE